ncbi:putative MFS general substrate transporter [Lyophyllum shimeji]|uniref:MFS general substrate transporter n=1 Tax=Lyophyllum shimeji TaxID=47721 RepID=A0A9P3UPU4_LYOSH|nr:putative MFS general substrate transporter [Lyophyllum shimeji]
MTAHRAGECYLEPKLGLTRLLRRSRSPSYAPYLSIGQKLLAGHPLKLVSTWELLCQDFRLPPMIMPVKSLDDVTTLPNDTARTSSERDLHSPTETFATTKEDLESAAQPSSTADMSSPQFPEGGLRAWLTVLGGTMVSFCTFGVVQSFGVYQDYYTRMSLREHTPSSISWIGSVQVFFVFAIGLPAGRLFDAGYFHHCLLGGSLIYLFSIFMLSLVQPHHYYQNFLAQGVGMGIGMGLMFLPSLTVTSHYFRARRSLAMGVVISGSSVGGCLYPILLNNVFAKASDFGMGVRAVAFMDLGWLIIANLIMRTRMPAKTHGNEGGALLKEVVTDGPYLLFMLGAFLVFWGVFVPFFYLQLYAALHGVSPEFIKYSITVMNASSIFGRTVPNRLADRYGPLNIIIPSAVVSGGLVFAMFGASSIAGASVFGVFYGFFSGGVVSVVTPAAGSFVTRMDYSDLGIRIGLLSFTLAFALLTGNPIAGALLSPPHYRWHQPLIFAAAVIFGGAACHTIARRAVVKRKGTVIV